MGAVTLILSAIAGFLAFWAGTVSLIGFAGWKQLAERFPAHDWPEGEGYLLKGQSATVGVSNYNNALNAVLTGEGLYLRPLRLFAYNHPPLFIPWAAVRQSGSGMLGGLKLELEGGGTLTLRGRMAKEVKATLDVWASALDGGLGAAPEAEEVPRGRERLRA